MITAETLNDRLSELGIEIRAEGDRLRFRAPEGALTADLREQLREHRDELLVMLRRLRAAEKHSAPLSWTQLGLWLVQQAAPDSAAYHVAFTARITSFVDLVALRAALQALVDRHEILRTTYPATDGELRQEVVGHQDVNFELDQVPGIADEELWRLLRSAYQRPFDLEHGSMMRARLFTRSPEDHVLLMVWPHIAVDGWSTWILLDEFRVLYEAHATGGSATLPRPGAQYADFARWQASLLEGPEGDRLWSYWRDRLAGAQPLNLSHDRSQVSESAPAGKTLMWQVCGDSLERLKSLASAERSSLFVVLLAAFKTLLFRYTGQEDVLVGTPTFGRSRPEFHALVGDLVNTVPLRTDLSGAPTFRELISRVRETALGALAHADYPFALLVRRLGLRREPGRAPVFDVLFNFQTPQRSNDLLALFLPTESPGVVTTAGLRLEQYSMPQQEGQFDLSLELVELDGRLNGSFKYRSDLFETSTIERMSRHWAHLIEAIIANPDAQITSLPFLAPPERRQLIDEWNNTATPVPGPLTLHGQFEVYAAASPNAVAVVDAKDRLTYGELDRLATRVARHLVARGVVPGSRVAIAVDRSVRMVAALLGILKSGGSYVPLDPSFPRERLAYMVEDSGATLVLTERTLAGELVEPNRMGVVYLEDCLVDEAVVQELPAVGPNDEAYVIYTSGSTGRPKGVVIEHRAAVSLLYAYRQRFGMTNEDRWIALTTLSFDPSVLEIFGPLSCGAAIFVTSSADVLDAKRLSDIVDDWRPTFVQATPTAWRIMLNAGWKGSPNLSILIGGEALTSDLAKRLLERCRRLFNVYGPTETTVWSTAAEITDPSTISVGRPLANVRTYVLDPRGEPVPMGVPGELYIGGAGVARGYHARPELTAERFLPDPFGVTPDARMYQTGDLVRWRADGGLDYLGRLDHQIKVRGHRIEPGEIENVLERHPAVRQAVVVAQGTNATDYQIMAYIVPEGEITAGDLRRFLRDSLPDYMIPAFVQKLDRFPLTPSGKVDRNRLPAVELDSARDVVPARTELEASLVRLWEELLDVRPIGVMDNFFDLGGHSLLAIRLCARLSEHIEKPLHVATLFQTPTIAELAARLTGQVAEPDWLLVPLGLDGPGKPFFCVPGAGDNPFIFADLARHLGADRTVYSFKFPDDARAMQLPPREAVAAVARRLNAQIRSIQPTGPYLLGGYCLGGLIAFEMAQQLRDAGEQVAALTIFEMFLPGSVRLPNPRDRVAYHLRHFRSLGWRDRLGFVARHGRQRLTRLGRRLSPQLGHVMAQLAPPPVADYTPERPYPGRLALFRGSAQPDGLAYDHDMGWGGLASEITVHLMEGHHTDAYKEPSITAWISELRDELIRAESAAADGHILSRAARRLAMLSVMMGPGTGYFTS